MNSRYMPILAAALLAAAPALHAQGDDGPPAPPAVPTLTRPLPPPPPPAATDALLRYKFSVGQVLRFRTVANIAMKITAGPNHPPIPMAQHIETILKQTVQSVDPLRDTATLTVQVESMQGMINGQPMPMNEDLKTKLNAPTTVVMSSTGKVLSLKLSATAKTPGFDPSQMNIYQQNGAFPVRAVKPGDAWTSNIDLSSFGAKVISNFQLLELTPSESGAIARIKQTASGTINSKTATALPAGMTLIGRIAMTGETQFDVNAGSIKMQSTTAQFDATVGAPKAAPPKPTAKKAAKKSLPAAAGSSVKIHLDTTSTMTRLDAAPADQTAPAAPPAM